MVVHHSVVSFIRSSLKVAAFLYIIHRYVLPNHNVKKAVEGLE